MISANAFNITLQGTTSEFVTQLAKPLYLDGDYEVALVNLIHPRFPTTTSTEPIEDRLSITPIGRTLAKRTHHYWFEKVLRSFA